MSAQTDGLRQRGTPKGKKQVNGKVENTDELLNKLSESGKQAVTSEWDYKLALLVITVLSFITRFWGISHPNEVVFDEVHFGKVGADMLRPQGVRKRKGLKAIAYRKTVRIVLSHTNLFLRCTSPIRQTVVCPRRMVGGL